MTTVLLCRSSGQSGGAQGNVDHKELLAKRVGQRLPAGVHHHSREPVQVGRKLFMSFSASVPHDQYWLNSAAVWFGSGCGAWATMTTRRGSWARGPCTCSPPSRTPRASPAKVLREPLFCQRTLWPKRSG